MHVDLHKRRIFRWTHYTELSGHRARCIPQRSSRRRTYSGPALWKSLRAVNNANFCSAADGDCAGEFRHQFDALVCSWLHQPLHFFFSDEQGKSKVTTAIREKAFFRKMFPEKFVMTIRTQRQLGEGDSQLVSLSFMTGYQFGSVELNQPLAYRSTSGIYIYPYMQVHSSNVSSSSHLYISYVFYFALHQQCIVDMIVFY